MSYDLFIDELGADQCDELMFRNIRKDWIADELGLMHTKWFDYRFLHPVVATFIYAKAYDAVFRRHYRASFDSGELKRVFKSFDIFKMPKSTLAGLWRGRQHADALGMPYEVYIDLAFAQVLRFWQQANMPQPLQLYSPKVVDTVTTQWEERQAGMLHCAKHPEYKVDRYRGTRPQNDHHEWLFAQAFKRHNPRPLMERFIGEDLIPAEKVEARLESTSGFKLAA